MVNFKCHILAFWILLAFSNISETVAILISVQILVIYNIKVVDIQDYSERIIQFQSTVKQEQFRVF